MTLAEQQRWRLVLVGDDRQLQAVGRGGLFHELCVSGRVEELAQIHRFTHRWEAAASLQLRAGDPQGLDAYEAHGRIIAGSLNEHLARIATAWIDRHAAGETTALVASSNDHVDAINAAVQTARITAGHLDPGTSVLIGGGERAYRGDVVATRRNDRRLITTAGEAVRNRETWAVSVVHLDGALTVTQREGHGAIRLPVDYVREYVRLGYAATEHGYQSATVTAGIELASVATTRRGLYVGVTRGRDENLICVITDSGDVTEARDVLDAVLAVDRVDIAAVTQRRNLATQAGTPATRSVSTARQPERCRIPDWFGELLADAHHDLSEAEGSVEFNAVERRRLEATVNAARLELAVVARATAPQREMLAVDRERADEARLNHASAERHLAGIGRRGRRRARRGLDIAERVLDSATSILERTRPRVAADVERYRSAVSNVEEARADLSHHDLIDPLSSSDRRLPDLARNVTALDTWQLWANGELLTVSELHDAVKVLAATPGTGHGERERTLGHAVLTWADTAGIDLHIAECRPPSLQHSSPELGL